MQNKSIKINKIRIEQSPRDDITPELKNYWGDKFNIVEKGALDNYSFQEIQKNFSPNNNEDILVTRLNEGEEVIISHKYIQKLLQRKINELSDDIDLIVLLCTGVFDDFDTNKLIIRPHLILDSLIKNIIGSKKLGIIIPNIDQKQQIKAKWEKFNTKVFIQAASPYKLNNDLNSAAKILKNKDVDLIYMDCLGYSNSMKRAVSDISETKVMIPRLMLAAIIKELF